MRYLLAIGGNAIEGSRTLKKFATVMWELHSKGHEIIITHGNGPQVGELAMREEKSLAELTAQTQAEIGIILEDHLLKSYGKESLKKHRIATVFTRVVVDPKDSAFRNPTKPVGRFYAKKEAAVLSRKGLAIKRLVGGYRRVVASPIPKRILEIDEIEDLLSKKYVVIAGGGGGVAVAYKNRKLAYLDAVIDKDYTSSLLAIRLHADALCFFTNVNGVYLNYNTKGERKLNKITAEDLEELLELGMFEEGSIGPKVAAAISFVKKTGKSAVIGSLARPENVVKRKEVTVVTKRSSG
jgi:carbamate kinase